MQDNASPDGTFAFLQTLDNKILRVFQNKSNLKIYGNMVEPLLNARGKYVLYLTDDDYMLPHSLRKILAFLESSDYSYIRLNLITFLQNSIIAFTHRSFNRIITSSNASLKERASVLTSAHILTGNIYKRDKIDLEKLKAARDDEIKRWFAYVVMSADNMDSFAFIPEVLIMHTWENAIYWDGHEDIEPWDKYRVVKDALYRIIIDSSISDEMKRECFIELDPSTKVYPHVKKYLSNKDILKLNAKRKILAFYMAFKKIAKKILS